MRSSIKHLPSWSLPLLIFFVSLGCSIQPAPGNVQAFEGDVDLDSVHLSMALQDALTRVRSQGFKDSLSYMFTAKDSANPIKVFVWQVNVTPTGKDIIIRRELPWMAMINLFNAQGKLLIEHKQGGMTYLDETVADVNGDELPDLLVHWYPSSGCCLRNVYTVYIQLPANAGFTGEYRFINPTFFSSDSLIRGVGYGHPGETNLYKYKWNGLAVDTIEYIYPVGEERGQFVKTSKETHSPTVNSGVVLDSIPSEYFSIEGYDWFLGF